TTRGLGDGKEGETDSVFRGGGAGMRPLGEVYDGGQREWCREGKLDGRTERVRGLLPVEGCRDPIAKEYRGSNCVYGAGLQVPIRRKTESAKQIPVSLRYRYGRGDRSNTPLRALWLRHTFFSVSFVSPAGGRGGSQVVMLLD